MNKYIVEVGVRVTNAVFIETFEVEADSEEEALEWLEESGQDAIMLSSYVVDEGETMSEEVMACFKKKNRKPLSTTVSH